MESENKADSSKAVLFSRSNPQTSQEDVWDDRSLIRAYDRTVNRIKAELSRKMNTKQSGDRSQAQSSLAKSSKAAAAEVNEDEEMSEVDEEDYETGDEEVETNASDGEEPPVPRAFVSAELKKPDSVAHFSAGDLCLAVYSEDGLVYPAKILKMFNNANGKPEKCLVQYLYYLNEEEKLLSELYEYQGDHENDDHNEDDMGDGAQQKEAETKVPRKPKANEPHSTSVNFLSEFNIPPPPLPLSIKTLMGNKSEDLVTNEDALHSMLMSWYMSGYHTGFYLGFNQAAKSREATSKRK